MSYVVEQVVQQFKDSAVNLSDRDALDAAQTLTQRFVDIANQISDRMAFYGDDDDD